MQQAPEGIPDPKPEQSKQPNSRLTLIIGGILLILVLVLIGGIGLWSNPGLLRLFQPSCTVGVVGTTTTVTLQGWSAPQGCDFFVAGGPVQGVQFSATPQTPTGPIVCAGPWKKSLYITVRDQNNIMPIDNEICHRLLHVAPTSDS